MADIKRPRRKRAKPSALSSSFHSFQPSHSGINPHLLKDLYSVDSPTGLDSPKQADAFPADPLSIASTPPAQLDPIYMGELFTLANKDDIASMEHPLFSIKKGGNKEVRRYEHNGYWMEIVPSQLGSATIWDKDIVIYISTLMRQRLDIGGQISDSFEISAMDLLRSVKRSHSGRDYEELYAALVRLKGTVISTNIPSGKERQGERSLVVEFSIIQSFQIMKDEKTNRMTRFIIQPSTWFREQIYSEQLLTIDPEYFDIRSGLERRLYELCRKHCGQQSRWKIKLSTLQKKVGAECNERRFRFMINEIIRETNLGYGRILEYLIWLNEEDLVHVYKDSPDGRQALMDDKFGKSVLESISSPAALDA